MKSAGKARSNGLYRHIRTSKEIIRNLLNDYANSFIMVSAYGRIAAKRLVYAYLGTCMPCPCAEILDKGWDANKPQAKKEVIEDAPRPRRIFHCALPRVFQPN